MIDEHEEKSKMVQMLLDMLKKHASDEVGASLMPAPDEHADLAPHKDEHGMSIEKVSVDPVKTDEVPPEAESMADSVMAKGDAEDAMPKHDEMPEETGDEPEMPAFSMLMGKKKKK